MNFLPLVATLATAVLVAGMALVPTLYLNMKEDTVVNTYHPVAKQGGTLTNPELAQAVAVASAVSSLMWDYSETEVFEEEQQERLFEQAQKGFIQLQDAGVIPREMGEAYGGLYRGPDMYFGEGYYEVDGILLHTIYMEDSGRYLNYYMRMVLDKNGKPLAFNQSLYEYTASYEYIQPSMLVEEMAENTDIMQAYMKWMGLSEIDDWKYDSSYGTYQAYSRYSLVKLVSYTGESEFGVYPEAYY